MGYKDGKHDGQESQFQSSFDIGYENGFANGFVLGKHKGILDANQSNRLNDQSKASTNLILKRTSRGECVICKESSLNNSDIAEIIDKQKNQMNTIETTLKSNFESN